MALLLRPLLVLATVVAILVAIVLSLFSCGGGDESRPATPAVAPTASATTTGTTASTGIGFGGSGKRIAANDLKVGDCVGDATSTVGTVTTFAAVGCAELHDGEVYTLIVLPGAKGVRYPGTDSVNAKGQRGCRARLRRQATATAFKDPQLGFKFVYPTRLSWADGDREIRCMATFKPRRSKPLAQR